MRLTRSFSRHSVALVLVLSAAGVVTAQWGVQPEEWENDLVVEGTLRRIDRSIVRHAGALYDRLEGTIDVERVVFCEEGARVPATVRVFIAQRTTVL
jgi:hypothetical protein